MGLLKVFGGAISSSLADQWKEYFYCDSIDQSTLVVKGQKHSGKFSMNNKGNDNIITNGSIIAVNEGQCMLIVDQGKVVEVSAEPGAFKFDKSTEPTVFEGGLGRGLIDTIKTIGRRTTFGGDTGHDQRVYFVNIKEIIGNKYGTINPVPFRVVDRNIGLDVDISIRCNGEYSYKITNPILFYANVCGNVTESFKKETIESQLRTELLTALQPAFAAISEKGIRYSNLPGHTLELSDELNRILSEKWRDLRGIEIVSFGMNSVTANAEDEKMIKDLQKRAVLRDQSMAAATLVDAQAEAMKSAAKNENGAMMGFMGMGMASAAGGINANTLYAQASQQQQQQAQMQAQMQQQQQAQQAPAQQSGSADGWFCPECGTKNQGKFCMNCGTKKPAGAPLYRCDKCGWEPADPAHPPKFCPNCGDKFDDNDVK